MIQKTNIFCKTSKKCSHVFCDVQNNMTTPLPKSNGFTIGKFPKVIGHLGKILTRFENHKRKAVAWKSSRKSFHGWMMKLLFTTF